MMSFRTRCVVIIMFLSACSPQDPLQRAGQYDPSVRTGWHAANEEALIPVNDLPAFEEHALQGDRDAAYKLDIYYLMGRCDANKQALWENIALENGSTKAMFLRAESSRHSDNPQARTRARYWYGRLKNDHEYGRQAEAALSELK